MNKEELILNMDRCINGIAQVDCEDCPYNSENFCRLFLMRDALTYIKGEAEIKTAKKIFTDIDAITSEYMNNENYSMGDVIFAVDELKEKYIAKCNGRADVMPINIPGCGDYGIKPWIRKSDMERDE